MTVELTTPNNAFRYPTAANNGTNFGAGIADLAADVDAKWSSGTLAARPAAGTRNRLYYATDTGLWYLDTGAAWQALVFAGSSASHLVHAAMTVSGTAAAGQQIIATAGITVTLPAPSTANQTVVVTAGTGASGSSQVTVSTPSGGIYGLGISNVGSFSLGAPLATVTLLSDGTNWAIISGQQDTGWVSLTLLNSWTSAGGYTPSARLLGDRVFLKGHVSSGAGSTLVATLASQFRPASSVVVGAIGSQVNSATVATTGDITAATTSFGLALDGLNYSLS